MRQRLPIVSSLVVLLIVVSGCTNQVVTAYGDALKTNFISGCTVDRKISDKEFTQTKLAAKDYCACVYKDISSSSSEFAVKFSDLTDYESKVADAKAGQQPTMPDGLKKAITDCNKRFDGPQPAGS